MCRILRNAEYLRTPKSSKEKFSLKSFLTLKPSWPPKPAPESPESQEPMISPSHSTLLLPPSPELPSDIRKLKAAAKANYTLKFPAIRKGVKVIYEEASCEPMDTESYYALEKVSIAVHT